MKLTRTQEKKVAEAARTVRLALRKMTFDESYVFVAREAHGFTLRQLRSLQNAIEEWSFKRNDF